MSNQVQAYQNLLQEFLQHFGFIKTLETFTQEFQQLKSNPTQNPSLNALMQALDEGKKERFFRIWHKLIPSNASSTLEANKLEFYIQVFFAVYPLHPIQKQQNPKPKDTLQRHMEGFRSYLTSKGSELSRTEEFLHFYALPYIPSPMDHPSFKQVFTRSWLTELKERIGKFVKSSSGERKNQPMLVKMAKSYKGQPIEQDDQIIQQYQAQLQEVQDRLDALQQREEYARTTLIESQSKWTQFAKDILNMTKELYSACENAQPHIQIEPAQLKGILSRILKFDNFLNMSTEDVSQNVSFTNSQIDYRPSELQSPRQPIQTIQNLPSLDFDQLINDLLSLNDENQLCSLLQALRWRLTRSLFISRKKILDNYIKADIFPDKQDRNVLERLFTGSRQVLEYFIRLLNVVASKCVGRSYILSKNSIIHRLTKILFEEEEDTLLRQNALGTLQKLSLRRNAQSIMIDLDMIYWLAQLLSGDLEVISLYSLEYATALLMNLSLRTSGKDKIEGCKINIINVLNSLLENENTQVRTYVNGTLYSILTRSKIKEQAFELGMDEALRYLMDHSDEHFQRQIQYIIDQLNNEQEDDYESDNNDDDDQDDDESDYEDFIEEDEDMDDIIQQPDLLTGEELLANYISNRKSEPPSFPPSVPMTPQAGRDMGERDLPSEMRSRPKIPRTPIMNPKQITMKYEPGEEDLAAFVSPKFPEEANQEGANPFVSRDKILRSPL